MTKLTVTILLAASVLLLRSPPGLAHGNGGGGFSPGAAGLGDPYLPDAGNGGYDVDHYDLEVRYDPATDVLVGRATISARATQNLSRFNLDFDGLSIDEITVEGRAAAFTRAGGELSITPARGLREHKKFKTVVSYHGVPDQVLPSALGAGGFFRTPDGALVVGQPHVASTWFPANDHPRDAASFTLAITAPADREVVANGRLVAQRTRHGWTTWTWDAKEPMATYLVGWTIGRYTVDSYRAGGLRFVDAVDIDHFDPTVVPLDGETLVFSGSAAVSYKRMTREVAVPSSGATLEFSVDRDTEPAFDFFFVEARRAGSEEWTTLPDLDGFATPDTGFCALVFFHPFILSYQDFGCVPTGLTGEWWAASGASDGWERWRVDLSRYAGQTVEISLAYASDDLFQLDGVAIDAIALSTGEGTTSFEAGDTGGWQVPGTPPPGTVNDNDWFVGTIADAPPPIGETILDALARQPEILSFQASLFGEYPFRDSGAIVHDQPVGFALENQTRPIYPGGVFTSNGVGILVHELAHQWFGNRVRVDAWQHIWLNEGFATYAEWLWSEAQGEATADETFASFYFGIPPTASFWRVKVGDPGPPQLFNFAIYARGAMTLHQLRLAVGDDDFFRILRRWASRAHTGTTDDFIALAEDVSEMQLDDLFTTWLFTIERPPLGAPAAALRAAAPGNVERALRMSQRWRR